jgi:hypothetical protein
MYSVCPRPDRSVYWGGQGWSVFAVVVYVRTDSLIDLARGMPSPHCIAAASVMVLVVVTVKVLEQLPPYFDMDQLMYIDKLADSIDIRSFWSWILDKITFFKYESHDKRQGLAAKNALLD